MAYQKSIKLQSRLKNRINHQIGARELRVIDSEGKQVGVLSFMEAMRMAEEVGLDLIEINATSNPPIAKIADWGKYRYENEKKMRKTLSANKSSEVRMIKIGLKIGEGDLDIKLKKLNEFLLDGDKVRLELKLRGRENAHTDLAFLLLDRICVKIEDSAAIETETHSEWAKF